MSLSSVYNPLIFLDEISLTLLSESDSSDLIETVLHQAMESARADSGSIALLDEKREFLEIKASVGLEKEIIQNLRLKVGQGVTGRCILTGRTKNIGDIRQSPHYIEVRKDILSEMAVPLKVGKKSFGVISVDSSKLNAFETADQEYLEVLSGYAAQILANRQAIQSLHHRTYIQELLLEISGSIGKYPEFEKSFHEIIQILTHKIKLTRAAIHLYDEIRDELFVISGYNYTDQEKTQSRYASGEGVTGKVFETKETLSIADIRQEKKFMNKMQRVKSEGKVSFIAAPILLDDQCRGVYSMELPYQNQSYFEDYTFLVRILSSLFARAIQIQGLIEKMTHEIQHENIILKRQLSEVYSFGNIVGSSAAMKELFEKIRMIAHTNSSVLITGESGTGKELIASALHQNSIRKDNALVKINCAAIPTDLLESELFGFVKGAFTNALEDKPGKFLVAHKGSIFLDEIAEMDYKLQSKILRVLQEKEFTPLGSNKSYQVDTRIIAATNANVEELMQKKKFREDLYYRLNVVRLHIPPLRERKDDLPMLIQYLANKIAKANQKKTPNFTPQAFQKLKNYHFPGNIRELENILERAIVLTSAKSIKDTDIEFDSIDDGLYPDIYGVSGEPSVPQADGITEPKELLPIWIDHILKKSPTGNHHREVMKLVESKLIEKVLNANFYQKSKTARELGINRITLDKKITEYNLMRD